MLSARNVFSNFISCFLWSHLAQHSLRLCDPYTLLDLSPGRTSSRLARSESKVTNERLMCPVSSSRMSGFRRVKSLCSACLAILSPGCNIPRVRRDEDTNASGKTVLHSNHRVLVFLTMWRMPSIRISPHMQMKFRPVQEDAVDECGHYVTSAVYVHSLCE